ncbi:molybdate ABC transporter permease subunit [Fredinandcohnia sp. 179-A 10B2 NHS]|uniref:molybdate ABC transporter permease subunit n=1 Tax=Fredinandcohnia sp. 179-A 10B2 NHS TaxID=3235176 RepID=UPI00399F0E79
MEQLFWSPIKLSITVAISAGIIVLLLGLVVGRWMSRKRFNGKLFVETILMLPLVLPPSVVGFFLIVFFGRNSAVGKGIEAIFGQPIMFTWWAAVIASTVVAFPLMYQSVKTGFQSVDIDIEGAARVDGANEWKVFLLISIPLSIKAIITGFILSFTRALGEFGATLMFAGNIPGKTQTLPTAIYVAIDSGNMNLAWMWVITTVVISFLMLASTYLIK